MDRTTLRRPLALLASAALLGSLAVVTTTAPVVAQVPTCDGQPATITGSGVIVGTDGDDVIVGSDGNDIIEAGAGNDIICGGRGFDTILGEGGRDRIFGGSGDDVMDGGPGPDDLFGFSGNDLILGKGGNDFINGGTGIDNCQQGAGSGPVKNCERADLKVTVLCPSSASEGPLTCRVRVKNLGPDRSAYWLETKDNQGKGGDSVECANNWETVESFGRLRPGGVRTIERTSDECEILKQPAVVWFRATIVSTEARDPVPGNNEDDDSTSLN